MSTSNNPNSSSSDAVITKGGGAEGGAPAANIAGRARHPAVEAAQSAAVAKSVAGPADVASLGMPNEAALLLPKSGEKAARIAARKKKEDEDQQADRSADGADADSGEGGDPTAALSDDTLLLAQADTGGGAGTAGGATSSGTGTAAGTGATAGAEAAGAGAGAGAAATTAAGMSTAGMLAVAAVAVGVAAGAGGGGGTTSSAPAAPVADTTAPVIQSMSAQAGAVVLTYNEALDAVNVPVPGDFAVTVNGVPNVVTGVAVAGTKVTLTLTAPVVTGDTVNVTYTDPTGGNDVAAIQDAAGNDAISFTTGVVADGYIRGAQIYIDTNNNGLADASEALAGVVTNANGNFILPAGVPAGAIIATGGVNIDTGVPNTMILKAPAGSTMVSPLTTLVQAQVEKGTLLAVAKANVLAGLGLALPPGADLTTYDPLATSDVAVQKAATQVATLVSLAVTSATTDANTLTTATSAVTTVIDNLVTAITTAVAGSTTVDLTDNATITTAITGAVDAANVAPLTTTIDTATTSISVAGSITAISTAQSTALDTTAPAAPTSVTLTGTVSDTGTTGDNMTNDSTPVVRVSFNNTATDGTAAVIGNTVKVFEGATQVGTATLASADIANGYVDVTLTTTLTPDGSHSLTAKVADIVPNTSAASTAYALTLDTAVPSAPAINLVAGNDIINASEASSTITGTNEAGTTVALSIGGNTRTATVSGTTWSYTLTGADITAMGEGAETLSTTQTDTAGNVSTAATRNISVDTVALAPTIDAVATDNIINATEQTVAITGTNEAGATVALTIGANTRAATVTGTTWSYTLVAGDITAMGEGTETLSAIQTDAAGNVSTAGTRAITVDTVALAPVINAVATDNIINASEATGAITGTAEAGATVALTLGSGNTRSVTADGSGNWTYTLVAGDITAMGEGAETLSATQTDVAGNVSSAGTRTISVDTGVPSAPTIDAVATDDIINGTETASAITGTADANATVSLTLGGGNTRIVTADGSGNWTYTLVAGDITAMGEGAETLSATQTDTAGNVSTAGTRPITVDTVALAPVINAVATDNIINASEQTAAITGTNEAGATVALSIGGNTRAATVTGTTWSYTLVAGDITAMGEGAETLSATQTDAAGNISTAGTRSITVDTLAPTLSSSTPADEATDVVASSIVLTFNESVAAGAGNIALFDGTNTLNIAVGDTSQVAISGSTVTITPTVGPAPNTTYTVTIASGVITDVAGNAFTGIASGDLNFTMANNPSVTITSGEVDNLLNVDDTAVITFTLSQASSDFVLGDITVAGGTLSDFAGSGTTYTATLTPATNSTTAATLSVAAGVFTSNSLGNIASSTFSINVDTVPPVAPTVALTSDTGSSASDNISSVGTLNVTGIEAGATTQYSTDGGTTFFTSFTAVEGANSVQVRQKDSSLNASSVTTLNFTLDTTIATPTVALTTNSGSTADSITNSAALNVSNAATDVTRTYAINSGTASATYTAPTADGTYTVLVTDTDTAGNTANASVTFTLDKTLATPTVALTTNSGSTADTISNSAALTFSAAAGDVTRGITINGGASAATYTAPTTDGSYTVVVTDTDTAGNTANATLSFTRDTTIATPTVALTTNSGSTGDSITNSAALTFSNAAADVTRTYVVDSGTASNSYTAPTAAGAHTVVVTDTDTAGNTANASISFTLDTTAPTLASSTPADNATAISPTANIVLTFSENIAAGTGNIVVSDGTNSTTIDVTDATQVAISGTTLTINPTADLSPSTSYNVQLASGVITDVAGNAFAGITSATVLNFTTAAAPTLSSSIDNVTNFDVTSNIVLTATSNVTAAAGKYIHIVNDGGTGFHGEATVNTQDILVTDVAQVTIVNNTIIINPAFDLDLANNYHITVDAGAFTSGGVDSIAVTEVAAMNFSTVTPSDGLFGVGSAATSQAMNATGNMVASYKWMDIEGVGTPSASTGTVRDLSGGDIAMVFKDYDTTTTAGGAQDGIGAPDFYVAATNFAVGDLLYVDNQLNTKPNDLNITTFLGDTPSNGTTQISFGTGVGGLGGLVEVSPTGTPTPSFATVLELQTLLGTTYLPIITA